jgi:hypothetical protein
MATPIYVSWDKREGRIEARIFVASYMAVSDAEIGRHEQLAAEFDEGSPEALALDEFPFQYESGDDDEIYEDITGERVPKGFYAFMHEGDLFLGAHVDLDGDATQDERDEVWAEFKADLEAAGFVPEWID